MTLDTVATWLQTDRLSAIRSSRIEAFLYIVAGSLVTLLMFVIVYIFVFRLIFVTVRGPADVSSLLRFANTASATFSLLFVALTFVGRACYRIEKFKSLKVMMAIAYWGPSLFHSAILAIRRGRRARRFDVRRCATVLWYIASRDELVPLRDLYRTFADGSLKATLHQLRDIDGVVFSKRLEGVILTEELKQKLAAIETE